MMIKFVCRVLLIVLYSLAVGIVMANDGQPKEGNYSAVAAILSTAITFALMAGAGTFD